ncbi:hypothetical protein ACQ7DA_11540 [Zafaria sp. J156]|uniref:hypothetical protein n=1 Tax=Zafaria sp. J156 TaxID=3116490 RepID=UPI002E77081D|nr:hypothetical protein [Zafaria sp. J156]MEE1621766.1 hypothetical protein [Zafaria sp. J156]
MTTFSSSRRSPVPVHHGAAVGPATPSGGSSAVPRPEGGARRPAHAVDRFGAVARLVAAVVRFYRVNAVRAAAIESEHLRLREDGLRRFTEASGGRL